MEIIVLDGCQLHRVGPIQLLYDPPRSGGSCTLFEVHVHRASCLTPLTLAHRDTMCAQGVYENRGAVRVFCCIRWSPASTRVLLFFGVHIRALTPHWRARRAARKGATDQLHFFMSPLVHRADTAQRVLEFLCGHRRQDWTQSCFWSRGSAQSDDVHEAWFG